MQNQARPDNKCRTWVVFSLLMVFPLKATVHTHCGEFGSRCTGTGGSSFVPVQIQPDFLLSHLLEEINTYFLKFYDASGGMGGEGRKAAMQILINAGFHFPPVQEGWASPQRKQNTFTLTNEFHLYLGALLHSDSIFFYLFFHFGFSQKRTGFLAAF